MNKIEINKWLLAFAIFLLTHTITLAQSKQARINYISFTVNEVQKKIIIDWAVDDKVPANYFELQRSLDGINFRTIALVMGPDPKQANADSYECFDKPTSKTQKYFYRLNHISADGESELSETKMLAINK